MSRVEVELRRIAAAHGFEYRPEMTAIEFAQLVDAHRLRQAKEDIEAARREHCPDGREVIPEEAHGVCPHEDELIRGQYK